MFVWEVGLATHLQLKIATKHFNANGTGYNRRFELSFEQSLNPIAYVLFLQNWVQSYSAVLQSKYSAHAAYYSRIVFINCKQTA